MYTLNNGKVTLFWRCQEEMLLYFTGWVMSFYYIEKESFAKRYEIYVNTKSTILRPLHVLYMNMWHVFLWINIFLAFLVDTLLCHWPLCLLSLNADVQALLNAATKQVQLQGPSAHSLTQISLLLSWMWGTQSLSGHPEACERELSPLCPYNWVLVSTLNCDH